MEHKINRTFTPAARGYDLLRCYYTVARLLRKKVRVGYRRSYGSNEFITIYSVNIK